MLKSIFIHLGLKSVTDVIMYLHNLAIENYVAVTCKYIILASFAAANIIIMHTAMQFAQLADCSIRVNLKYS